MSDLSVCFVGTRRGNEFMNELLAALAHEVAATGTRTTLAYDRFPPIEGRTAYVVVPHEYFELVPASGLPSREQLGRTISLSVEQPGTKWFDKACGYARHTGAIVDIQRSSLPELRRRGLHPEHLQLGYTEFWDVWRRDEALPRPVDVLFMGSVNARRVQMLGSYAQTLWPLRARIFIPPEAPKTGARANFLVAEEKWEQLARSKTIVNVRRERRSFFEWVRVVEAIANGCVVVTEHAAQTAPLEPGVHYLSGSAENLAVLARGLVEDEERLRTMRLAAYDLARTELPMRRSAERLAELAGALASRPRPPASAVKPRPTETDRTPPARDPTVDRRVRTLATAHGQTSSRVDRLAQTLKGVALENVRLRRRLDEMAIPSGEPPERVVYESPAWAGAEPHVTVCVPLYNHAGEVQRALTSVAAVPDDVEVLVFDDSSTDDSPDAARACLARYEFLPSRVIRSARNRGVGAARNRLIEHARAPFVFMLDADNEVYPSAIGRLAETLEADTEAVFAYSILEEVTYGKPTGLLSGVPWDPDALKRGNYIDAMSLLRRDRVRELGGYTEDLLLYGWEDFDLWCRIAENGGHGAFLPEILCRYHQGEQSMLTVTNIHADAMWRLLRRRYPRVLEEK